VAEHTFAGLTCAEVADLAPAFVLGALEAAESDSVRRHLAACPEAHPEMAELHSVVPALFETVEPVAPPAGLKERILTAAAAGSHRASDAAPASAAAPVPSPAPAPTRDGRPVAVERQRAPISFFRRPIWAAVSLAAVLGVVALGAWNVQLQGQYNQLQNEVAALEAYREGVVEVLDSAAEPGAQLALLSSGEGGPSGLAAVAPDGRVALVMRDLAPTTGSQVYETWVIGADGAPVPVGGFIVRADGTASFMASEAPVAEGVTIALTLEPAEEATTPTMPIIAAGVAQSQDT
jgi:anti-sigma-K factor RskA